MSGSFEPRILGAADLARAFTFPDLIEALAAAFRGRVITPVRHHHVQKRAGEADATLLLMPAWTDLESGDAGLPAFGVKVVSVIPGNAARLLPSVIGTYALFSGRTGELRAVIDGAALTLWRTAAASALAARFLAPLLASRLLMVGAGALAPYLVEAHAAVRPIREVSIWNRNRDRADVLAARLSGRFARVRVAADLDGAVGEADIVSCATMSATPLVRGARLKPGAHLDLVGGFTPAMREADDDAVRRARIFVDTRAGAFAEAGDLVDPISRGIIAREDVAADLAELCRGEKPGRTRDDEITLFKSVGTALADLAAAQLAVGRGE